MMEFVFFHRATCCGHSITRSFTPLIAELKKRYPVREYNVPYAGAHPLNVLRNILFVRKHRSKTGVNHVTGDIHYCILGLMGVQSILTVHDDYAIIKAPNVWNRIYKWIFWIYLPIKLADRTDCITEETYRKVRRYVHSRKMGVFTPHAVDVGYHFFPHQLDKSCPRILQIGTDPQKNLESTIRMLAGQKCHLRVVREMTPAQHKLARALNVNYSNVYNLTDEEMLQEYEKADIVVFPSIYEGFGMPIMEAQAIGRAVITTRRAPMDWVAGKDAALLDNPLDIQEYRTLFERLVRDDNYRAQVIVAGLENVKRFRPEMVVERYISRI